MSSAGGDVGRVRGRLLEATGKDVDGSFKVRAAGVFEDEDEALLEAGVGAAAAWEAEGVAPRCWGAFDKED